MKKLVIILSTSIFTALIIIGFFFWYFRDSLSPALLPPAQDITEIIEASKTSSKQNQPAINLTDFPLRLPPGFKIDIFARDLPKVRVIAGPDYQGNLWVSQTKKNLITKLLIRDGQVVAQQIVFNNLNQPHGLTFDPDNLSILYIAETDKIVKTDLANNKNQLEKIIDLPTGGRHFTRTINFGPDGRLYVSIGSSCDTCLEKDNRRAAIYSLEKDGSDFKLVANGLRNAVFFTWQQTTSRLFATEMGRDFLGDNLPPDEVNIVEQGKDYGWPVCYGNNIPDTKFDYRANCQGKTPAFIDIPAHSAPLGLAFLPLNSNWPVEFQGDLIIAYHGSWNRSVPTGYKLVRADFSQRGEFLGLQDFITGWLQRNKALGRPVDVKVFSNDSLLVSDDKAGVIYKITFQGN